MVDGLRRFWATVLILSFLLVLAGALAIPFVFESPSMWYKFGMEKISLRSGKMMGMAAGLLLLVQLPLAGRLKTLDRIFSLPLLMRQHRIHAWAVFVLALLHPFCVLLAEGTIVVPLEARYWPEWIGVALWVFVLVQFVTSRWRKPLGISFHRWLMFHRFIGLLVAILLVLHVLYVSETFTDEEIPSRWVLVTATLFGVVWLWVRTGRFRQRKNRYTVSRIEPTGSDATMVEMAPVSPGSFTYAPGQFAFLSFHNTAISKEPHPFTVASAPNENGTLQFVIRSCGDWTRKLEYIRPGDKVLVQGPFGHFSHLYAAADQELIFIAGGIGITPMLSMLRFMADREDTRPVTLIWSNRSPEHIVLAEEMDRLADKLTGLHRVPIFTRNTTIEERSGRLNRTMLASILSGCSRRAAVFICGPYPMMARLKADLRALGFPTGSIFSEAFGL